jgi:syntaxin 1B/2/3
LVFLCKTLYGLGLGDKNNKKNNGKPVNRSQECFDDIEIVKSHIAEIKDATRRIIEINQNVLQATTNEKEQDLNNELAPIIKSTNKRAAISKQLLLRLKEDSERIKTSKTASSNDLRIRENLTSTVTRKFVDVMKEYQNAQTKYKTDIMKKAKRQVQIVKPDVTQREMEAIVKSGGGAQDILKTAILNVINSSLFVFMFYCYYYY